MAIKVDDYLAKLPKKRQQAIARRAAELIAEEATLRQLRVARERSQEEIAIKLHIKQAAVSKLERRTDMYLSTLRTPTNLMRTRVLPSSPFSRVTTLT
jgi:DNA-directed RNA polymerase specialized sigma subunit